MTTDWDGVLDAMCVDYSNKEMQDIQGAVLELLTRVKDKINERGLFKISRIQPCGSMAEKTSLWKTCRIEEGLEGLQPYIEFDYLAVLETSNAYQCSSEGCSLCMKVKEPPFNEELAQKYHPEIEKPLKEWIPNKFVEKLYESEFDSVVKSTCGCISDREDMRDFDKGNMGCNKCTVDTHSGCLQMKISTFGIAYACSVIFMWTSYSMSSYAAVGFYPDTYPTSRNRHLAIFIDFIPALELFKPKPNKNELEHDCFIVSKKCVKYYECGVDTWRLSGCLAEIDHIVNRMSVKHRECLMVLKYFTQGVPLPPAPHIPSPSYHVKTAVLNHSLTCAFPSEECVFMILEELKLAYVKNDLRSFSSKANLLDEILFTLVYASARDKIADRLRSYMF